MSEPQIIRPNRRVFVIRATFRTGVFTLPLVLLLTALAPLADIGSSTAFGVSIALWVALVVYRFIQRTVVFGKTRYLLHRDRIVLETGGLLSERSVDLQFRNVTQTSLKLPFIEHKLYQTGHVSVQAAGSSAAEVVMESIDEPEPTIERIIGLLRDNGFSLSKETLVQQEKPGIVGAIYVLTATMGSIGLALAFSLPGLIEMFAEIAGETDLLDTIGSYFSGEEITSSIDGGSILAGFLLAGITAFGSVAFLGVKTLDILKRTYSLYDDVIDYKDGFLTKHHSFIPMENLADVELNETIVQRVLSISSLKVSCQGAGADIRLNALPNGEEFKTNLERLIDRTDQRQAEAAAAAAAQQPQYVDDEGVGRSEPDLPPPGSLPRVEGKYDWKRGVAGPIAGLVAAVVVGGFTVLVLALTLEEFGAAAVGGALFVGAITIGSSVAPQLVKVAFQAYGLTYAVDERKVMHSYEVLNRKQIEFTVDKISAVEIRRTPIDRMFGTARVSFTSIGTTEKIKFEYLKNADEVVHGVLGRMGLDQAAVVATVKPRFTLDGQVRAVDFLSLLGVLLMVAAIPTGVILPTVAPALLLGLFGLLLLVGRSAFLPFYYRRARLDIGETWLRVEKGLWARQTFYAPNRQIRGLSTRCYIGDERGAFEIHSGGGARGGLAYMEDARGLQDRIDQRLHRDDAGSSLDRSLVEERRPKLVAALLRKVVLLLLFVPAIPWAVLAVKRIRYVLERERIARESGVLFKRRYTILLARIDHLTTSRGVINRITSTGAIGIRTLGSIGTDMSVADIEGHGGLYERIEGLTKKRLG